MKATEPDTYDLSVGDPVRREEVGLTARLIVAASDATTPLTQAEIDRILGVGPPP
jgi:hypothetical protein